MSSLDVRAIDETDLRHEKCPTARHEYRVFLSETAFDRAVARGESDTTREIGGVLVGELLRDDAGPYLRVEDTIDALHAEEKGAELTFTHATWEHIHKEMDSPSRQGKRVVGWYHTHPGFGVFLSDRDQFIHKSFFNLPFQIAFVYDPKSKEHGVFAWRDHEITRVRRYWIGAREHAWDGARSHGKVDKDKDKDKDGKRADVDSRESRRDLRAAEPDTRDEGTLSGMTAFVVIAVVLVLVAGFVGHWIGSASARSGLIDAQLDATKAKQEGAQLAIASLQNELVGMLRDTLGDQAVRKPAQTAIAELDKVVGALKPLANDQSPARPSGRAGETPYNGTPAAAVPSAGSAAPPAAGSGSAAPPATAGSAAPPAPAKPDAVTERVQQALVQIGIARASLTRLLDDRGQAEAVLAQLERASRRNSAAGANLAHDVAEQRSGLGRLYAETAVDAAKAGDIGRARRLLAAAAHLDPGNRARYEKQLQTFDKSATLPQDDDAAGSQQSGSGDKP